jgi:hypothetical protein
LRDQSLSASWFPTCATGDSPSPLGAATTINCVPLALGYPTPSEFANRDLPVTWSIRRGHVRAFVQAVSNI